MTGVARHVAAAHRSVAEVVAGRPTADWFAPVGLPPRGDPSFPGWFVKGTAGVDRAGVEVAGDAAVLERWPDLVPAA